jgi:hypothetical protein
VRHYQLVEEEGRDLLVEEVASLYEKLIDYTEMDTWCLRQDSLRISSNANKMGVLKLVDTVNANIVKLFRTRGANLLSFPKLNALRTRKGYSRPYLPHQKRRGGVRNLRTTTRRIARAVS